MNGIGNVNFEHTGGGEKVGFFKHVFSFDDKSKNSLINSIQYLILLVAPLKFINDILEYLFENQTYSSRNSVVILLELVIEMIIIIVLVMLIHRFITFIPTYSGVPIDNINLIQIAIAVAFYKIHTNERFRLKLDYIIKKISDELSPKDEKVAKNAYNPLQPVVGNTNNLINTHNPSQADYLQNINPSLKSLEHQAIEQSQNNNNISLGLLPQQMPQMQQAINMQGHNNQLMQAEPEAANGSGGFSSW